MHQVSNLHELVRKYLISLIQSRKSITRSQVRKRHIAYIYVRGHKHFAKLYATRQSRRNVIADRLNQNRLPRSPRQPSSTLAPVPTHLRTCTTLFLVLSRPPSMARCLARVCIPWNPNTRRRPPSIRVTLPAPPHEDGYIVSLPA